MTPTAPSFPPTPCPKSLGEIRRFLRDDGQVKVSRGVKEALGHYLCRRTRLTARLGREPSLSELSEETGWSRRISPPPRPPPPLSPPLQMETAEGFTLERVLGTDGMEESVVERVALRAAIDSLPEREKQVILLRFYKNLTQDKAARVLGGKPGAGLPHRAPGGGAPAQEAGVSLPSPLRGRSLQIAVDKREKF